MSGTDSTDTHRAMDHSGYGFFSKCTNGDIRIVVQKKDSQVDKCAKSCKQGNLYSVKQ